jgi:hypothetical protein
MASVGVSASALGLPLAASASFQSGCAPSEAPSHAYFGASGQRPVIGPNASSPLMTFTTL